MDRQPHFAAATRAAYDVLAADYADRFADELAVKPFDRAVLAVFAELVRAQRAGAVVDVGCGPGRIAAHLNDLGLSVSGIDLSLGMVEQARRGHPHLRFREGSMTALDIEDGSLGGIVAWYSIIHVPDEHLPRVLAEFHRVLAPGGYLQLAFAVGDEVVHRTEVGGHPVSLDFHPRQPDHVAELLGEAGLREHARLLRQPDEEGEFRELTPQCFLLARKAR